MDIVNQILSLKRAEASEEQEHESAPKAVELLELSGQQPIPIEKTDPLSEDEITQDDSFSYDGYQVVRGEFFAHVNEPSVTFNCNKIYVNKACLRKLPEVEYIQFLMNSAEKKMVLRPCTEDAKDGFRWCATKGSTRTPKQISCRVFFAMVVRMMEWNPDYRYKMLGKIIRSGDEKLAVFDLTARETYRRIIKEGEKPKTSRRPVFPEEWGNQFGLSVEEHRKQLQVNIFDGYTVFTLKEEKAGTEEDDKKAEETNKGEMINE